MNKLDTATRIAIVGAAFWLLTACGPSVTMDPPAGGGSEVTGAQSNTTGGKVKQDLPPTVTNYNLKSDIAIQKSGVVDSEVPADAPLQPGAIQIERADIKIESSGPRATIDFAQAGPPASRTVEITVWIGEESEVDSVCQSANRFGPYIVTVNQDFTVQSIRPRLFSFSEATRARLAEDRFSICFLVEANFDAHVEIRRLTFLLDLCANCDDGDACTDNFCVGEGEDEECSSISVDCDDGNECTDDSCEPDTGICENTAVACPNDQSCDPLLGGCVDTVECVTDVDCDDGVFCNGDESCVNGRCDNGASPCNSEADCDESLDLCVECRSDADCDDGLSCTTNTCDAGTGLCAREDLCLPDRRCIETDGGTCVSPSSDEFCTPLTVCGSCVRVFPCGWCFDAGADDCFAGDSDGPTSRACDDWAWEPDQCR